MDYGRQATSLNFTMDKRRRRQLANAIESASGAWGFQMWKDNFYSDGVGILRKADINITGPWLTYVSFSLPNGDYNDIQINTHERHVDVAYLADGQTTATRDQFGRIVLSGALWWYIDEDITHPCRVMKVPAAHDSRPVRERDGRIGYVISGWRHLPYNNGAMPPVTEMARSATLVIPDIFVPDIGAAISQWMPVPSQPMPQPYPYWQGR